MGRSPRYQKGMKQGNVLHGVGFDAIPISQGERTLYSFRRKHLGFGVMFLLTDARRIKTKDIKESCQIAASGQLPIT